MWTIGWIRSAEPAWICFLHFVSRAGVALFGCHWRICDWKVQERAEWVESASDIVDLTTICSDCRRLLDFHHPCDDKRLRFSNYFHTTRFVEADVEEGSDTDCSRDDQRLRASDCHRLLPRVPAVTSDAERGFNENREGKATKENKRTVQDGLLCDLRYDLLSTFVKLIFVYF